MKRLDQESSYTELLERLAKVHEDSARQWGTLSANQMICHMADTLQNAMGSRPTERIDSLFSRTVMKWGGLWAPMDWPHGLKTLPALDQAAGGTPPSNYETDIETLRSLLARFRSSTRDFTFAPHPLFGDLTRKEWMRLMYRHLDHHLRQFGA